MLWDWLWPLQHYSVANHVPYGYASWSEDSRRLLWETGSWPVKLLFFFVISPTFLVPVLPLIAITLFLYWTHRSVRKQMRSDKGAYYCVMTGMLAGLLISIVAVRADIIHFMYLQPLYVLVVAWIFDGRDIPGPWFRAVRPVLKGLLTLAFLAFAMPLLLRAVNPPYKVETRRGVVTMPANDTVVPYIQAHVPAGGSLLVYPYLPLYNYLTATVSPVPYDYFQPGMNTPEQGQSILNELKSDRVRSVLFEPSFAEKIPPSWPATPEGAIAQDQVADYIARHYRRCKILDSPEGWRFQFMMRSDLACP